MTAPDPKTPAGGALSDVRAREEAAFKAWFASAPATCSGPAYAFAAGVAYGKEATPPASDAAVPAGDRYANDAIAKVLYDAWADQPGWTPWVERGNSDKQDEARRQVPEGMKPWGGGDDEPADLAEGLRGRVLYRDGGVQFPVRKHWKHTGDGDDIIAYEAAAPKGASEAAGLRAAVEDAFNDVCNEYGAQGYGRDTPAMKAVTAALAELQPKVIAALTPPSPSGVPTDDLARPNP